MPKAQQVLMVLPSPRGGAVILDGSHAFFDEANAAIAGRLEGGIAGNDWSKWPGKW